MSLFTLFCYKRSPTEDIERVFADLMREAHVQPLGIVKHSARLGNVTYHLHAILTPTALFPCKDQVEINDHGIVCLNGFVYKCEVSDPDLVTAANLSDDFSLERFIGSAGEYAVAHVSESGVLTALTDPERIRSLYYLDNSDIFAISTRPSMLTRLTRSKRYDMDWIAAVSSIGYGLGPHSAFKGIKAIQQDEVLKWDGLRIRLERIGRRRASEQRGLLTNQKVFAANLDQAVQAATNAVRLASQGTDSVRLAITGGKDSRLLLALCLAGGLRERLSLFTKGEPDHPDCVVGRMIAEKVGLPHQVEVNPKAAIASLGPEEFLHRIRASAYQTDGLCGCWDLILGRNTGKNIIMSGFMGEIMKAFDKAGKFDAGRSFDPADIVTLQSPFDPIGFLTKKTWPLRKTAKEKLSYYLEGRFETLLAEGFARTDLPDLYYYENRIPNWLGTTRQVNGFTGTNIMPLGVPPLVRLAFTATAHERAIEQVHYSIIQGVAPELLDIPFAMQLWHPALGAPVRKPVAMPNRRMPAHGSWQHAVNNVPATRSAIISCLQHTDSELWSVVDRGQLIRRLQGGPLSVKELISLLGTLPMLFHTSGTFEPQKLTTAQSELPLIPWSPMENRPGLWQKLRKRMRT